MRFKDTTTSHSPSVIPHLHLDDSHHENQARMDSAGFGGGAKVVRTQGVISSFCTIQARVMWLCRDRASGRAEEQAMLVV